MRNSPTKKLRKLLTAKGYELASTNDFGVERYELPDCTPVTILPGMGANQIAQLTRQIHRDSARHDPENTPAYERQRSAWVVAELEREAREKADRERVRPHLFGGIVADQPDHIVDALERRVIEIQQQDRQYKSLLTHRPQHDIRV